MPEIVQFPNPNLCDIPAMLRRTADMIEAGDYGEVTTAFLLLPETNSLPRLFGWGDVDGDRHPVVQLEQAKFFLLQNLTGR